MKMKKKLWVSLLLGVLLAMCSYASVFAMTLTQTAQTQNAVTVTVDPGSQMILSMTITLQKYVKSANGYEYVNVQGPTPLAATATSYTFSNLAPGSEYRAKLDYTYKYSASSSSSYNSSDTEDIITLPTKVTGLHQAKWWYWALSCDFEWNEQDACKYEWVAYQKGKKSKQVAQSDYKGSSTKGSFKVKNNKMYTVKVRAFTTINNVDYYGDWSDEVYMFTQPMVPTRGGITIDGSGKMHVKWDKIDGIDSYEVYVSTKEKSGYKKVAKVKSSKGSATIKKLKKKKFKKNKTYYVYIVANKKVNGKVCTSGRHYTVQYKKGSLSTRWTFD